LKKKAWRTLAPIKMEWKQLIINFDSFPNDPSFTLISESGLLPFFWPAKQNITYDIIGNCHGIGKGGLCSCGANKIACHPESFDEPKTVGCRTIACHCWPNFMYTTTGQGTISATLRKSTTPSDLEDTNGRMSWSAFWK
jgi:hypothetical protein